MYASLFAALLLLCHGGEAAPATMKRCTTIECKASCQSNALRSSNGTTSRRTSLLGMCRKCSCRGCDACKHVLRSSSDKTSGTTSATSAAENKASTQGWMAERINALPASVMTMLSVTSRLPLDRLKPPGSKRRGGGSKESAAPRTSARHPGRPNKASSNEHHRHQGGDSKV